MQLVLRGLSPQHVISYLDDILVTSNNMEDHMFYLDQVLSAVERAGLKLNPAKCNIAQDSVVCLGHRLSKDGMSPDPANVAKIKAIEIVCLRIEVSTINARCRFLIACGASSARSGPARIIIITHRVQWIKVS